MKSIERNLVYFLEKCAKAHGAVFHDWREDAQQVVIDSDSIPVVADVRSIVKAFAGDNYDASCVEDAWSCTTVYLDEIEYAPTVDMVELSMALPSDTRFNESKMKKDMKLTEAKLRSLVKRLVREEVEKAEDELFNEQDFIVDEIAKSDWELFDIYQDVVDGEDVIRFIIEPSSPSAEDFDELFLSIKEQTKSKVISGKAIKDGKEYKTISVWE